MDRITVASSNVASVGYDAETAVLEVEFRNGGIYHYEGVPQPAYDGLMASGSIGAYLNANIKSQYGCTRV